MTKEQSEAMRRLINDIERNHSVQMAVDGVTRYHVLKVSSIGSGVGLQRPMVFVCENAKIVIEIHEDIYK